MATTDHLYPANPASIDDPPPVLLPHAATANVTSANATNRLIGPPSGVPALMTRAEARRFRCREMAPDWG